MRHSLPAVLALLLLVATLPALLFASGKDKDFPLHVHIVGVNSGHPAEFVVLDLAIPSQILTIHIDGDPRELTMIPYNISSHLHLGDYNGHWNTNGSLEIQWLDKKGKPAHRRLLLKGERPLPPEPPTENKPPTK